MQHVWKLNLYPACWIWIVSKPNLIIVYVWPLELVSDFIPAVYSRQWATKALSLQIYPSHSNPPKEFVVLIYKRSLTYEQSLKWHYVSICSQFCKISPCFQLCQLWKDELNAYSLQLKFLHIWSEKIKWLFVLVFTWKYYSFLIIST